MNSIEEWVEQARRSGERYHEFLRIPSMSAGVYLLPKGAVDGQSPHGEDEIYHVVRGRAHFTHRDVERAVGPGSVLIVPAREPHRFHTIEEDLVVLVVFAPAESPPLPP
ncbi:MAG: cupin domain-containing protein [Thermoplasmata archaeon]|nr:cupin domain-containing protein [Thermoplasmata archaeon]